MSIKVLYVDIRDNKTVMEAYSVSWKSRMSAKNALEEALGEVLANEIAIDLNKNNPEIIVAWHDEKIEQHSEVGGVGDLNWEIVDRSVLTIVYENVNTTEHQVDLSSHWMIQSANGS